MAKKHFYDAEIRSYRTNALGNRKSQAMVEGRTHWLVADHEITWSAQADTEGAKPLIVRISVEQLREMAKRVREKNLKRTFYGNVFFDAK